MNRPTQDPSIVIVRWGMLIIGLALLTVSLALKIEPSLLPKGSNLAADAFGKVALVLLSAWLAWPAVMALKRAPGGMLVLAGVMVAMLLFTYRPRTLYLTGPFVGIAAALALIYGWIRKNSAPPPTR